MKGEFKFKNTYNMTENEIKDMPVKIDIDNKPVLIGILTHIEDGYVYGIFNHNQEYDIMIELTNKKYSLSIELDENYKQ